MEISDARMALCGLGGNDKGSDEALAVRLVAGVPDDDDKLEEMRANLARFGVVAEVDDLADLVASLGEGGFGGAGMPSVPALTTLSPKQVAKKVRPGKKMQLSTEWDWDTKKGNADKGGSGSLSSVKSTGNIVMRGQAEAESGILRWTVRYIAGGSEHALNIGIIQGEPVESSYSGSRNVYTLAVSYNGNIYVNGRSKGTNNDRRNYPGKDIQYELDMNDGTKPGTFYMTNDKGRH